jgi:hypothetical protein
MKRNRNKEHQDGNEYIFHIEGIITKIINRLNPHPDLG